MAIPVKYPCTTTHFGTIAAIAWKYRALDFSNLEHGSDRQVQKQVW